MKKKTLLLTLLASAALLVPAEAIADRIILKSGEVLEVYNIELGGNSVFYSTDAEGKDTQKVSKAEVFGVKIGDGKLQPVDGAAAAPAAAKAPAAEAAPAGPTEIKKAPADNNTALLASYSANQYYLKDIHKKKQKNAPKSAMLTFRFDEQSVLSNEDIEISFETGFCEGENWIPLTQQDSWGRCIISDLEARIEITNKTDKILYLDLGQCMRTSDVTGYRAFYDGTQTYETKGQTSGAGVNLGAVAGALGVGGALGTLASGVNVGGSNSTTTTTVKGQQRVMVLPPKASVILPPEMRKLRFDSQAQPHYETFSDELNIARFYDKFDGNMEYEMLNYTEQDTPVRVQYLFTYSDRQDFATYVQPRIGLYVSEVTLGPTIWSLWNGYSTISRIGKYENIDGKALIGLVKLRE